MSIQLLQIFFTQNRFIILFIYGQVFFILGISIFLQSRKYSRLKLARHLRWLAGFGILHGFHEWGLIFIPLQESYLSTQTINNMQIFHLLLLSLSFICLLKFGIDMLETNRFVKLSLYFLPVLWAIIFIYSYDKHNLIAEWISIGNVWSRYLLGLPGALVAALGLYRFTLEIKLLSDRRSYQMLQIAGISLFGYAIFGGLIVPDKSFFPANIFNYTHVEALMGIPVEVFRSLIGLMLAYSIIRAMEIFNIEVDQMFEKMEISNIQRVERDRIGQEIHDGVLQSIYSASLITGSLASLTKNNLALSERIEQLREVLNQAIVEMRDYMVSLRIPKSKTTLKSELLNLVNHPRFTGLVNTSLDYKVKEKLAPSQCNHVFSIVQEGLSNIVRHAKAKNANIVFKKQENLYLLTIVDDGIGFDPKNSNPGFGLETIRDHTQLLGGEFLINSELKKGTKISIRFGETA